jgi:hypothetical protein
VKISGLSEAPKKAVDIVSFLKTGDSKIDSAVKWLLGKSKKKVLSDGTVTYFFSGTLPRRMVETFVHAKGFWGWVDDSPTDAGMGWERPDEKGSFTFRHGNKKSTWRKVRFMADDYRVPAAKHKGESVEEARKKTFKAAKADVINYLKKEGWKVVDRNYQTGKPMKIPHATSPDGRVRLWFKAQSVYVSEGPYHEFKGARSSWVDIRSMSPAEFVADVEGSARKPVKHYW